jgi:hypothetical protein
VRKQERSAVYLTPDDASAAGACTYGDPVRSGVVS